MHGAPVSDPASRQQRRHKMGRLSIRIADVTTFQPGAPACIRMKSDYLPVDLLLVATVACRLSRRCNRCLSFDVAIGSYSLQLAVVHIHGGTLP